MKTLTYKGDYRQQPATNNSIISRVGAPPAVPILRPDDWLCRRFRVPSATARVIAEMVFVNNLNIGVVVDGGAQ